MFNFDDLLNAPLPSTSYNESGDDLDKQISDMGKEFKEEDDAPVTDIEGVNDLLTAQGGGDDIDIDSDDDDIDSDLDELSAELNVNGDLTDSDLDDVDGDDNSDDDESNPASAPEIDYDEPAEELDGKDDEDADNMLSITATPMLLEEACTCDEIKNFTESGDSDIAVEEGFVMESDINQMISELSDSDYFTESTFASPNQKYRMTKKARFNQLFELSLQIEARAHHDPLYPKLMKAYKIERTIKKQWRRHYGSLAAKRAKRYLRKLIASKSSTLKTAAKRIIGK